MHRDTRTEPAQANPDEDTPMFVPQDWDKGQWSVQHWLERTAWRTLKSTEYGHAPVEGSVLPAIFDDGLLRQVCLIDIATFIGAERTSFEASAGLLRCAPDERSKVFFGTQVLDECRHYEIFCKRMADFGVTPEKRDALVKRYTTPAVQKFYDLLLEQVDKKDFIAGSLAQNIIMEGMAYPLYRYQIKYWSKIDPSLSQMIRGAFADEAHHVSYGEAIIGYYTRGMDPRRKSRLETLMGDFSRLMTEAFEQAINHYIGLYQECANQHMSIMGDIEIFPGVRMSNVTEADQVRMLLGEIQHEHAQRSAKVGLVVG
jgi:hypothetical protein